MLYNNKMKNSKMKSEEFSNYERLFGGVKDSGNGQILIWRRHEK
jgi:hypothetical protein